jgi:hypothetical protein
MGWTKILLIYKQTYQGWKHKDLEDLQAPKRPFVLYSINMSKVSSCHSTNVEC